ncbi:MAG: isoprenyl transferase [Muribaculaceae bacterium]|nr:isoprenyl transferase [Muribaculaceae bacterium]
MNDNHNIDITSDLDMNRLPEHVAIIMDGNGRWARRREMMRSEGHAEGVNSVNRITRLSSDLGIKYLTLYAFSTENWNRPQLEVDALMHLIGWTIRKETPDLVKNNVKIHLLGEIDRLPESVREDLEAGREATAECTGLNLNICLSYSSRWELTDAVRKIAEKVKAGTLLPSQINEETIQSELSTADIPDPDLLIRTGGEHRISNFLLWQCAYSELYFTPVLWPDFDNKAFIDALLDYQKRERRYGLTSDQISEASQNNLK